MSVVQLDTQEQAFVKAIAGGATTQSKVATETGVTVPVAYNVIRRLVRKGVVVKNGQALAVANVVTEAAPVALGDDDPSDGRPDDYGNGTVEADEVQDGDVENGPSGDDVPDAVKAAAASAAKDKAAAKAQADADAKAEAEAKKAKRDAQTLRNAKLCELYASTSDALDVIVAAVAEATGTAPLSIARARQILAFEGVKREAGRAGKGSTSERDAAIVEAIKAGGDVRKVAEEHGLSVARTRQVIYAAGVKTSKATTPLTSDQERAIRKAVLDLSAEYNITLNRIVSICRDAE